MERQGRLLWRRLVKRGAQVRPFWRREIDYPGVTDSFVGNMTNEADWEQTMAGVDKVYHICPNMHEAEVDIGRLAVSAALKANVAHFVYHSVLHPQTEAMPHHWHKLRVEERLFESKLPFTILQPTAYMQNIRANWSRIKETAVYAVPYPVNTQISLVDLIDVAEVAAMILSEAGHVGATYELVGTRPLSQVEVARELGERIDRIVTARKIPLDTWQQNAAAAGLSPYAINTLKKMFRYYAANGLVGNPTILRCLLGREPTSLVDCAYRW